MNNEKCENCRYFGLGVMYKKLQEICLPIGDYYTPGPWEAGYMGLANGKAIEVRTKRQFMRHMSKTWRGKWDAKRGMHTWLVQAKDADGEIVTIAIGGNGPRSDQNARAIESIPDILKTVSEYKPKEAKG